MSCSLFWIIDKIIIYGMSLNKRNALWAIPLFDVIRQKKKTPKYEKEGF